MDLFFKYLIDYGYYKLILEGLRNTVIIAVCGLLIGIVLGSLVAMVMVVASRNRAAKALSYVCNVYMTIFRGTPIVVQLLIFYFIIFAGSGIDELLQIIIVFGLNSGAYVAEIMRGGILSVDAGQLEAGRTVGLSYAATMFKIVIPQAVKNVIPTLGNELIALTKDTSVVGYVATVDLNMAFTALGGAMYSVLIPYIALALVYLVLVILITVLIRLVERRLRKSEKRS